MDDRIIKYESICSWVIYRFDLLADISLIIRVYQSTVDCQSISSRSVPVWCSTRWNYFSKISGLVDLLDN